MIYFFQIATDLRRTRNSDYIDCWYDLPVWHDLASETTLNNYNYIIKNCIRYIIEFGIYKTENNKDLLIDFLLNAIRKYDITDSYIVIEPLLFFDNEAINKELYDILYIVMRWRKELMNYLLVRKTLMRKSMKSNALEKKCFKKLANVSFHRTLL